MRQLGLLLALSPVWAYLAAEDIGFFLVPRNNSPSAPLALTLSGRHVVFKPAKTALEKSQVFIQEYLAGGELCLKYAPSNCIKLRHKMLRPMPAKERFSRLGREVRCRAAIKKSKLNVFATPYHRTVMLHLHNCRNLCLFHHEFTETVGSSNFTAMLDVCKPGNINNMYRLIPENKITEYLAEVQIDNELAGVPAGPAAYANPSSPPPLSSSLLRTIGLAPPIGQPAQELLPNGARTNSLPGI